MCVCMCMCAGKRDGARSFKWGGHRKPPNMVTFRPSWRCLSGGSGTVYLDGNGIHWLPS